MLLFATVLVLADGDKKPFVRFAKGNFWKYDVVERKKKKPGKVEVAEIDKDGAIKVKLPMRWFGDWKRTVSSGRLRRA